MDQTVPGPSLSSNLMSIFPADRRRELPDEPGVYLFRDERGKVIYVGKAKSIKKRVASHFSNPSTRAGREILAMIDQIEALVVHTEAEALLVEQNFIKQYKPRLNIRLRDDKSYPYIAISLDEEFPTGLLHPRATPPRPRLLRPLQQRQAGPLHARGARQGVHVPLLRGPRARPSQRLAVPGLLHQAVRGAVRRLRRLRAVPPLDRRRDRLPVGPLQGDRAHARARDEDRRRRAALRGRGARAQPAASDPLAARTPAGRARRRRLARRDRRRGLRRGGERAGLPGPRRCAVRPAELLPRQRGRGRDRRGRRGVHPAVLRERDVGAAAVGRPARGRVTTRRWPRRSPPGAAGRSRSGPPSAATSAGSSSSPSATRSSRSTRRSCAPSAAASSASRRSTGSSRRSGSTRSRCGSSALTSRR